MKIAICISGQPRAYSTGFEYLEKNLLSEHDCEVFFHSWENNVYTEREVRDLYAPAMYRWDPSLFKSNEIEDLRKKYTNTPNIKRHPPQFTIEAFYSMFSSMWLMSEWEITHSKKFDWVVRTRFDFALNGKLPFEQLERGKIYIPNCRMVPERDFGNDQFAFGDPIVMKQHMSAFLYLDHYYAGGYQMIGEEMMKANLRAYGLTGDKLVYVNMNHPFPPGEHNGTPHSLIRDDMNLWLKSSNN